MDEREGFDQSPNQTANKKLKAFHLPQSTFDAILEATHQFPEMPPSEIIEAGIDLLRSSERTPEELEKEQ